MPVVNSSRIATGGPARASDAFLRKANPKLAQVLSSTPGLGLFLDRNSVSQGPAPGEVETPISWAIWNHSEGTNAKYGHGMKDDQIKNDIIVVFQPSKDPSAKVEMGWRSYPGHEIVGVYKLGDQITGVSGYDKGHMGQMNVLAHGKAGEKATVAWAVVSIGPDGRVRSGGYPTSNGNKPVPYQQNKGGGEYHGRAAEIVHGQRGYVPITSN
jgi:hypothetical protein